MRVIWVLCLVAPLAACGGLAHRVDHTVQEQREQIRTLNADNWKPETLPPVRRSATAYLGDRVVALPVAAEARPALFTDHDGITLRYPGQRFSLAAAGERIAAVSGIAVEVDPDTAIQQTQIQSIGVAPGRPSIYSENQQSQARDPNSTLELNWSGPMTGLLDAIAAKFGVNWEYSRGVIRFYRYATRTWSLVAAASDAQTSASVGSVNASATSGAASGSSQSAGSGTQTARTQSTLSIWKAVEDAVKTMTSQSGKVAISAATGTLTVTDTPAVLRRVDDYIVSQNRKLTRQVKINVKVFSVALTEGSNFGINWRLVYEALNRNASTTFNTNFVRTPADSSFGTTILDTATGRTAQWIGSQAFIDALETQGQVSVLYNDTRLTLNNRPVPINLGEVLSYYRRSGQPTVSNGVVIPGAPEIGELPLGFSMQVTPHILDDGQVLMMAAVRLASLTELRSENGSELPRVSAAELWGEARVRSGQTIVFTGHDTSRSSGNRTGLGHASNSILGGGRRHTQSRDELIVVITPVVENL